MIQIFTDVAANLPAEVLQEYRLRTLVLHYTVDGAPCDAADFDGPTFYEAMDKGAVVQTSMISPGAAEEAWREVLDAGDDVLYIGMSGGISGTYDAMERVARELQAEYPERRIHTVNTRGASLGEGLPVIAAAQCAEAGGSWDEVVARAEAVSGTMAQYFVVDDLKYLRRGGRISGAAALAGTLLMIKPILWGDHMGRIVLHGKVRGMRRAIERLAALYREKCSDPAAPAGIAHANNPTDALHLRNLLREAGHTGPIYSVMYEPVTGSHVGPGTVALFFAGEPRPLEAAE